MVYPFHMFLSVFQESVRLSQNQGRLKSVRRQQHPVLPIGKLIFALAFIFNATLVRNNHHSPKSSGFLKIFTKLPRLPRHQNLETVLLKF